MGANYINYCHTKVKDINTIDCLATFVDRKSKYTIILPLKNKTAHSMQTSLEQYFMNSYLPFKTITLEQWYRIR